MNRNAPKTAPAGRWSVGQTVAAFGALCLIWGLAFVVYHLGLEEVPALSYTALRAVVGGVGLAAILGLIGRPPPRDWASHRGAIILGFFNVVAFWGFQSLAMLHISAGEAAILVYLQPILVAVGARFYLGEKFTPGRVLGLLLGFGGVVAIVGGQGTVGGTGVWLGYLLGVGAALGWASGTIAFKRLALGGDILWITALQCVYGTIPLLGLAFAFEGLTVPLTFTTLWTVLYAGLGASAISYILWFSLLRQRAASQVAAFVFIVPLIAVLADAMILGHRFGSFTLVGGTSVVLGIWLVNRPAGKAASRGIR